MANPIAWTDVTGFAAELISPATPVTAQTVILSVVNGAGLSTANFGGEDADLTKAARILYACHLETLRRRKGVGGAISSQSEGGVVQSYYQWMLPWALMLTSYGMMLRNIISGTPARAGILVG